MRQIAFKFLAGGTAGLLAWAVSEPSAPKRFLPNDPSWSAFEVRLILMLGLLVGLVIGGTNGWLKGSRHYAVRGLILGGVLGACGALVGYFMGALIATIIFGNFSAQMSLGAMPGRTCFGMIFGAGLGVGIGASGMSARRTIQGLIGGALGGAIGGATFDPICISLAAFTVSVGGEEVGGPGRAVLCTVIGAFVGLLIGVVEQVGRVAWLRLNLGRNEGREWVLEAQTSHIGRDERAQVPLFGDPTVEPLHCSIVRQGEAYWLYDAGTPLGTYVNGQRVMQAPLVPGTIIQVGQFPLEFQLRAGSAPARAAERLRGTPMVFAPVQQPAPTSMPTNPVQNSPSPMPSGPVLVGTAGPAAGQRVELGMAVEIGREGAQVKLADAQASRKHARIMPDFTIEDLGSTNGTFVNGTRIAVHQLRNGDEVKIGQSVFRFEA